MPPPPLLENSPQVNIQPRSQSRKVGAEWPLNAEGEAFLMRHYIDVVSCFLDFTSPYPYFRFDVPQRSRTSSTLANAIFALSARHLAYTHGYDPLVADQYYSACLDHLIPALSNEDAALDDSLLTATILLRMLEEMDVDIVGSDSHGHLTGTAALIRAAQEQLAANKTPVAPVPRGLRQAAYWIAFRQEIYMSLQTHRPITLSARMCGFDEAHDWCEAPEWVWAQRAIAHCGDALAFAFGGGGGGGASRVVEGARARGRERWSKLIEDNAAWNRVRPRSFDPFFGRVPGLDEAEQPPEPVFPELRVMGNWQVLGYGYNILSRLVLLVHDPSIPKLGPSRKASVATVDKKLRRDVRTLCSIANSHLDHGPANIIALVAISMCKSVSLFSFVSLLPPAFRTSFFLPLLNRHSSSCNGSSTLLLLSSIFLRCQPVALSRSYPLILSLFQPYPTH
ncbi:hypothetical protein BC567DRAFT_179537 [Phyllosticta citribraziliensis]